MRAGQPYSIHPVKIAPLALTLAAILSTATSALVRAEEGGTGHHLPGSGVFLVGLLPAEPGFTVRFSDWFYAGSAESTRSLSGILQNTAQTNDGIGSIFSAIKNGNAQLPPRVAVLAAQLQDRVQATDVNLALDSVQNISARTILRRWARISGRSSPSWPPHISIPNTASRPHCRLPSMSIR
jgi:hypothetical protein